MARVGTEFIPLAVLHDNPRVTLKEYTSLLNKVYSSSGCELKSERDVSSQILQLSSPNVSKGIFNKQIFWHMMPNIEPKIGWFQIQNRFEVDTNSILNLKGIYYYKNRGDGKFFGEPLREYVWTSMLLTSEVIKTSSWSRIGNNIPSEYLDTDSAEFLLKNPSSLSRVRFGLLALCDCAIAKNTGKTLTDMFLKRALDRKPIDLDLELKMLRKDYDEKIKRYRKYKRNRKFSSKIEKSLSPNPLERPL